MPHLRMLRKAIRFAPGPALQLLTRDLSLLPVGQVVAGLTRADRATPTDLYASMRSLGGPSRRRAGLVTSSSWRWAQAVKETRADRCRFQVALTATVGTARLLGRFRPVVPAELLRHLDECEQRARTEVDRLHAAIANLSAQLDDAQELVSRLQLTRQTLLEIAEQEHDDSPSDITSGPEPLPPAYQEMLAVFTSTDGGLHAKDLCRALNIGDQPRHIESMRAKLKRLVGRDILTEPEHGLFTMNQRES